MLGKVISGENLLAKGLLLYGKSKLTETVIKFIEKREGINFYDTQMNLENKIKQLGNEYNLKFSFTFLKKSCDYTFYQHYLFNQLCPESYRSIEISNYAGTAFYPQISKNNFTFHFRSLFQDNGEFLRDIFPAGMTYKNVENPMHQDVEDENANFYKFIQAHKELIHNISIHLGIATNLAEPDETDGHSVIDGKNGGYQYCKMKALTQAANTITILRDKLDQLGYSGRLLLETLDYNQDGVRKIDGREEFISAYKYFCEPDTVNNICNSCDVDLLADIGHIMISIKNLYNTDPTSSNIQKYIDNLCQGDYSTIQEVHFVVPTARVDEHTGKVDLLDEHQPFATLNKNLGDNKWLRSKEYKLAIKALWQIVSRRIKYKNLKPLIINIETDEKTRNVKDELSMVVNDLGTLSASGGI